MRKCDLRGFRVILSLGYACIRTNSDEIANHMEAALTLVTSVAILGLFAITQVLVGRGTSPQTTRRLAHVAGAVMASTFPLYLQLRDVLLLGTAFSIFLTWTSIRCGLRSIHGVSRGSVGAQMFPVGLTIAAMVSWPYPSAYSFGAFVLGLADPAAAIIGGRVGGYGWKIPNGRKTTAGSLTFFAVAFILGISLSIGAGSVSIAGAITAAVVLAAIEGLSPFGLDNLVLPLSAAVLGVMLLGL